MAAAKAADKKSASMRFTILPLFEPECLQSDAAVRFETTGPAVDCRIMA